MKGYPSFTISIVLFLLAKRHQESTGIAEVSFLKSRIQKGKDFGFEKHNLKTPM
jgi:hypothetical protein